LLSRKMSRGRWLLRKEFRELAHSPAFAILLVLTSLLVGHEFISAVKTYSEMSGPGAEALARGMNPLDGILVPTFGAYDIVATLLLPFVVIRLFSSERATGAWHAEWHALTTALAATGGAAAAIRRSLDGLQVDVPRMRANITDETLSEARRLGVESSRPEDYLGAAGTFVDRALALYRA